MTSGELAKTLQIYRRDRARLHLNGPRAPASIKHAVYFKRLLAPVGDVLSGLPGMGEASVFDARPVALWIPGPVRQASWIDGSEDGVVQEGKLWRRGPPTARAHRMFAKRRNEESLLE